MAGQSRSKQTCFLTANVVGQAFGTMGVNEPAPEAPKTLVLKFLYNLESVTPFSDVEPSH
ncbi:MAG: hypothetical protein ABIO43_09255 [Sphingomicrobium sp.]